MPLRIDGRYGSDPHLQQIGGGQQKDDPDSHPEHKESYLCAGPALSGAQLLIRIFFIGLFRRKIRRIGFSVFHIFPIFLFPYMKYCADCPSRAMTEVSAVVPGTFSADELLCFTASFIVMNPHPFVTVRR